MSDADASNGAYRVLARKYRPRDFSGLIGQEPMVQTLSNAFKTGRIAQAYMLTGVRGVGKTTTARILARALNFESDKTAGPTIDLAEDGEHCQAIIDGRHMDVIEMDAASHTGIDDIRELIESAQYKPATARYKVYVIDEVHMLSTNAFNGLLKTLEEPPEHVKFIFATTEIRKVPVTVLSRCQRFDLRRVDAGELAAYLADICKKEEVEAENEALALIARAGDGSVRDCLSILDQAMAHGLQGSKVIVSADQTRELLGLSDRARIVDLFEQTMKGDISAALEELKDQYDNGADPVVVLSDLADFVHLVTRLKYVPDTAANAALSEVERTRGLQFAEKLSVRALGRAWQILLKGLDEVKATERPLAAAEMVLVRLTHASSLPTPDELARMETAGEAQPELPASPGSNGAAEAPKTAEPAPVAVSADAMPAGNGDAGGATARAIQPEPQLSDPQIEPAGEEPSHQRTVSTFEELVFLVEDKRDLPTKVAISRHMRIVAFREGRIDVNLVNDPPRNFVSDLSKKLADWTGRPWMVAESDESGQPTLMEQEQAESRHRYETAMSNPAVEAIMETFPGARILDVRVRDTTGSTVTDEPDAGNAILPPDED